MRKTANEFGAPAVILSQMEAEDAATIYSYMGLTLVRFPNPLSFGSRARLTLVRFPDPLVSRGTRLG